MYFSKDACAGRGGGALRVGVTKGEVDSIQNRKIFFFPSANSWTDQSILCHQYPYRKGGVDTERLTISCLSINNDPMGVKNKQQNNKTLANAERMLSFSKPHLRTLTHQSPHCPKGSQTPPRNPHALWVISRLEIPNILSRFRWFFKYTE